MKYIAQISIKNNGGCYSKQFDCLDLLRTWANSLGKSGDTLTIVRNGQSLGSAKTLIFA